MLQFDQLADIERRFRSELTSVSRNVRNDHLKRRVIAPAGEGIELRVATKLPSCSPVDVSHRSFLKKQPKVNARLC